MKRNLSGALTLACLLAASPTMAQDGAKPAPKRVERAFLAVCMDKPDSAGLRRQLIQTHLDYIDSIRDKVLIGGPSQAPATDSPHGSVILYRAATLDDAKTLLAHDPLSQVFAECRWDKFSQYVGVYVNGWAGGYTPTPKGDAEHP